MPPKEPTPSDRAPQHAPFPLHAPFARPNLRTRRRRAKRATVWTALAFVLAAAAEWFLGSRGVPAPIVEGAGRAIHDALPR
jgi:hypothetical protein